MSSVIEELESLLFDWEAGTLDDAGVDRVRELLRSNEEARSFFVQQQIISAAIKLDEDAGLEPTHLDEAVNATPAPAVERRSAASHVLRVSYWLVAAAALLICSLAGRVLYLELSGDRQGGAVAKSDNSPEEEPKEATSNGVALVTRLVDIKWSDRQAPVEVGDALTTGRLAIESGFAQVEFFCGATVVVEGPAELELKSATLARVHSGRLRAHVPPAARGFSLEVDDMKVVDLGTEFGLAVSPDGDADVQVFDGEVELHPAREEKQLLTAGEGVKRTDVGDFEKTNVTPDRFLDIAALEARADGQRTARYERWRAWSDKLRRDSRLIAYYTFDQQGGWQRKLQSSLEPDNDGLDGAIVGAHRVPGRWSTKGALEFKRPGDRVRVQIPGEFDSLTFACWTKIDSLDRWYNSLFLTDHYNQGEPHWQILNTGQLFFSVRYKPDDAVGAEKKKQTHQTVLSPPFWKPSLSGRWLHLATTYDAKAGRTKHYLNGELLHEEQIDKNLLVKTTRIGAASIGNWSIPTRPDADFAIRNLNGSIDEFAIFAAALSADEIKEMYDHGKP